MQTDCHGFVSQPLPSATADGHGNHHQRVGAWARSVEGHCEQSEAIQ